MLRRKNYFAVVTGANGETYAMGPRPRKHTERDVRAWQLSIGPAAAVKSTRATRAVLRHGSSAQLAELQKKAQGATP